MRRHARTVCLNTNGGVTTYIYVQLHTYSPTLSSSSFLPSSLLCISWVRISVTLIVTAHVSLNHLPLITVIFTTECRNTRIHRVTAAHACIDRPFMQSMGLHTRTQRMLGTPQFCRRTLELRTTRWRTRRDRDHHEEQHSPNAAATALIRLWTANACVGCYMCQTFVRTCSAKQDCHAKEFS